MSEEELGGTTDHAEPEHSPAPAVDADLAPALWPLAIIVAAQFAAMIVPGRIDPGTPFQFNGMLFGGAGGTLVLLIWWLTRGRVSRGGRWGGLALFIAALVGTTGWLLHPSMGVMAVILFVLPSLSLVLVATLAIAQMTGWRVGSRVMLFGLLGALAAWCGIRADGLDGSLVAGFVPRWSTTSEEAFLSEVETPTAASSDASAVVAGPGDWVGFRGPQRDGRLAGVSIAGDWTAKPPTEVWRRKVGPGWGSMTVVGGLLFTQEQRGDQEVVAAYDAATGEPRWVNEAETRFEESVAGAGPRATPTFQGGQLFTTGGSGVVRCLDAATGETVWSRDLTEDTSAELIVNGNWWGFASSPLIATGAGGKRLAIVYAGTPHPRDPDAPETNDSVIAYDTATGEPAWTSGVGNHGYGSPQLATLAGVEQVLVSSNAGVESLDPATGERLWLYDWNAGEFPRVVQPNVLPDDTIILATGYGLGTHAFVVGNTDGTWSTETKWETKKLKPYFNDLVHYEGYLYGFDSKFFTCLDAATGEVTWPRSVKRKAAFGHGQVLLLEDPGLLVIVTEKSGEAVLIEATPKTLVERGRIKALEGKTWNHPVVAGGRLYVRNGIEMACYELATVETAVAALP